MNPITFIGIDPGSSGGIGCISRHFGYTACKMPETDKELLEILVGWKHGAFAMIEQVHSMPGQGVASSFKFGQSYGKLEMALTASGIPFERVTPQKWQKALGCMTKGDKNVSKRKAQDLFPDIKVTHAIADALLIAEFCKRTKQ